MGVFSVAKLNIVCYSAKASYQIDRILNKLIEVFENPDNRLGLALEVVRLIAPLFENVTQKGYRLFHAIMQVPISTTYTQDQKLEAASVRTTQRTTQSVLALRALT